MSPGHIKLIKGSLFNNQLLGIFLIASYCIVYGIASQYVLSGIKLFFFLCSLIFALSVFYIRDPQVRKAKAEKGILASQITGTVLVFAYLILFGVSSISLLSGFQLIFFMSSYTFAMSIFYVRDPERIKKQEETVSSSTTSNQFVEKNPCFINSDDLSWLVRELNSSLSTVIGFSELMLRREHSESEKEYMLRNIYQQALSMSCVLNKAALIVPDSPTKPKEIHEVVDLLSDKNFK